MLRLAEVKSRMGRDGSRALQNWREKEPDPPRRVSYKVERRGETAREEKVPKRREESRPNRRTGK